MLLLIAVVVGVIVGVVLVQLQANNEQTSNHQQKMERAQMGAIGSDKWPL